MKISLTELQQFFGAYFNQDWEEEHRSADDVIDAFLLDSSDEVISIVRKEMLELISTHMNEIELKENLLHEQYCFYYYQHEWPSASIWLSHIIKNFDQYLLKQKTI